eukprot:gene37409-50487_t
MSNRTVEVIDADIYAVKENNPNWFVNNVDKNLIAALIAEKNSLSPAPATKPGLMTRIRHYLFGSSPGGAVSSGNINASLRNSFEETVLYKLEKLESLPRIEGKVEVSLRTSASIAIRNYNAYLNMTQTSAGLNKSRQESIRKDYYDFCGVTDKPGGSSSSSKDNQARCVLTGRSGKLKLAHLVPASANEDIRICLKLNNDEAGIWSLKNVLLLSFDIERAFDRTRLSFEPHPLQQNTYILKIWDPSVRDELIWQDANVERVAGDNTIGFYEGHSLQLNMPNGATLTPFKRCLSYQHFMCYLASKERSLQDPPPEFGSDIGGVWTTKRNDLLVLKRSLEKAIDEEDEEDA